MDATLSACARSMERRCGPHCCAPKICAAPRCTAAAHSGCSIVRTPREPGNANRRCRRTSAGDVPRFGHAHRHRRPAARRAPPSFQIDVLDRPFEAENERAALTYDRVARELVVELEAGFRSALILRPDPDPDASARARRGLGPVEEGPLIDNSMRFAVGHLSATLRPASDGGVRLTCVGSSVRDGRQFAISSNPQRARTIRSRRPRSRGSGPISARFSAAGANASSRSQASFRNWCEAGARNRRVRDVSDHAGRSRDAVAAAAAFMRQAYTTNCAQTHTRLTTISVPMTAKVAGIPKAAAMSSRAVGRRSVRGTAPWP